MKGAVATGKQDRENRGMKRAWARLQVCWKAASAETYWVPILLNAPGAAQAWVTGKNESTYEKK